MAQTRQEDRVWVVPELEVRVSESWIRFVRWCQTEMPYGRVTVQIVNAQPTRMVDHKPDVRFDKEQPVFVVNGRELDFSEQM